MNILNKKKNHHIYNLQGKRDSLIQDMALAKNTRIVK